MMTVHQVTKYVSKQAAFIFIRRVKEKQTNVHTQFRLHTIQIAFLSTLEETTDDKKRIFRDLLKSEGIFSKIKEPQNNDFRNHIQYNTFLKYQETLQSSQLNNYIAI